jgi:hypothetical protein
MRQIAFIWLSLLSSLASGCVLDPNSGFNVNRGEYHDEYDVASKEGRSDQAVEKAPDGMGSWLYSPKARAIARNLGAED